MKRGWGQSSAAEHRSGELHARCTPLQDLHTFVPIGGRPLSSLSFAEDIYLRLGSNSELLDLTDKAGHQREFLLMEISTGKSRAMVITFGPGNADICSNGIHLEEVQSLEYPGVIRLKDGNSATEIYLRITAAITATSKFSKKMRQEKYGF